MSDEVMGTVTCGAAVERLVEAGGRPAGSAVDAHVRSCMSCFRAMTELRDLPRVADALRAAEPPVPAPDDRFWEALARRTTDAVAVAVDGGIPAAVNRPAERGADLATLPRRASPGPCTRSARWRSRQRPAWVVMVHRPAAPGRSDGARRRPRPACRTTIRAAKRLVTSPSWTRARCADCWIGWGATRRRHWLAARASSATCRTAATGPTSPPTTSRGSATRWLISTATLCDGWRAHCTGRRCDAGLVDGAGARAAGYAGLRATARPAAGARPGGPSPRPTITGRPSSCGKRSWNGCGRCARSGSSTR